MNMLESHPDLILSLAKFTAALLLGMAVAPLIKRPALRAAFWTAMFLILPTMILVTHGRSILNILPVPTMMPTVTVQMESTQAPASTPVSPPPPIVVATPLAEIPPPISTVPTNNDITKAIETPPLTPPTPELNINWVGAIYFSGLIASLLPILISILRLRFAPKKSASDTAIEVWSMIRPEEAKVVPLYLTDSPAAPFTCGLIRAEVLLPESSDEWSMRRLRSTLYHESAHISRRDPLVRMFASLVRAMFWFHPLIWLAHRRLVAAQEEACDEIALAAGIPADEYAEDLLEAAKQAQGQLGHGLALARWSQLGSRIRIILQTNTKEIKQMNKKTIAIVTLGIAALCVGISSLGFNSQKPSDTKQEEEKPKLSSSRKSSRTPAGASIASKSKLGISLGPYRKVPYPEGGSAEAIEAWHETRNAWFTARDEALKASMDRWKQINEIQDLDERNRLWMELVDSVVDIHIPHPNLPDVLHLFVGLVRNDAIEKPEFANGYKMFLSAWAKANPMQAIEYAYDHYAHRGQPLEDRPNFREPNIEFNTVFDTWVSTDRDSAIAWAKSKSCMTAVIKAIAADDPVLATALLYEMPPDAPLGYGQPFNKRSEAFNFLLPTILARRDIAGSRAFAEGFTDPAFREAAMVRVAEFTALHDPQGTINWLSANPLKSDDLPMKEVISRIASKDSNMAISYFNSLPAGGTRASALEGIIFSVAGENPELGASLLEKNHGDLTDSAVETFVEKSFYKDPQGALSRIPLLEYDKDQERMYRETLRSWIKDDKQAAIDWVNSNTLPPKVVDYLNRELESHKE